MSNFISAPNIFLAHLHFFQLADVWTNSVHACISYDQWVKSASSPIGYRFYLFSPFERGQWFKA